MFLSEHDISKVRKTIESTYDCLCDIVEYKANKNTTNKRIEYKEKTVIEKQPCRISYETISNANETENESNVTQIVKLFIAPEIQIKSRFKNNSNKRRLNKRI